MKRVLKVLFLALSLTVLMLLAGVLTSRKARAAMIAMVEIVNPSTKPAFTRDVDNPAGQPFATDLCLDNTSGTTCGGLVTSFGQPQPSSFNVPNTAANGLAVRRLVIEYVSGICGGSAVNNLYLVTPISENQVNGVTAANNFLDPYVPPSTLIGFSFSRATRIYTDPGATVKLAVNFTTPSTSASVCTVTVNGYLVTN